MQENRQPKGELIIRTLAMPANTNPNGDIFGGWVVSQMDIAGGGLAFKLANSRVVTVAIDTISFISPVKVGDFLCCYAELIKVGRTSISIHVEAWVAPRLTEVLRQVTEGTFIFVAIDSNGQPKKVDVS